MNQRNNLSFLRMGVMNVTPNSFSDGGELESPDAFLDRVEFLNQFEAIDIGAESTAPMNQSISWIEEWKRLERFIPYLSKIKTTLSLDTYHPETIFEFLKFWKGPLIWNDVSGQFDDEAKRFLALDARHRYVYCHNLSPSRESTGQHMNFQSQATGNDFLNEIHEFFFKVNHPQVIFDPCLGFSKSYEQNWLILNQFDLIQKEHLTHKWLIGFSRKSFLRKKYQLSIENRSELDLAHQKELLNLKQKIQDTVWIRTHRPELIE